ELDELLLEGPGEATATEIPAVELLQEARRAALAELANGLADEEDELGDDLLAARLGAVFAEHLAQSPRVALRAAADHDRARAGRRQNGLGAGARGDVSRRDHRHVNALDELGRQRVVGLAGVHLAGRAGVEGKARGARLDEPRADLETRARAVLEPAA